MYLSSYLSSRILPLSRTTLNKTMKTSTHFNHVDHAAPDGASHVGNSNLTYAVQSGPLPPRPRAIATFLSTRDFLPGCEALLYSIKATLPSTFNYGYSPEIIVLLSSKLSNDTDLKSRLYPIFCSRIILVDHIAIEQTSPGCNLSHVKKWDEHCGWTKLRLFELDSYDTILYIDADCLVLKDVSQLLHIDDPIPIIKATENKETNVATGKRRKRFGLLAAAPDIFPPDKFNAGVMVIRPSKSVFDDMMSRLPHKSCDDSNNKRSNVCKSYDGGDTGFLNSYYPDWYHDMPPYSRLSFGFNAQRFMYHCTYDKQKNYWDEGIDEIRIIHFSSSPKPWEMNPVSSSNESSKKRPNASELYLEGNDDANMKQLEKQGALEVMWQTAFIKSQNYYKNEIKKLQSCMPKEKCTNSSFVSPKEVDPKKVNQMIQKRYKELRKIGWTVKDAMDSARKEFETAYSDQGSDPNRAVGKLFGLV